MTKTQRNCMGKGELEGSLILYLDHLLISLFIWDNFLNVSINDLNCCGKPWKGWFCRKLVNFFSWERQDTYSHYSRLVQMWNVSMTLLSQCWQVMLTLSTRPVSCDMNRALWLVQARWCWVVIGWWGQVRVWLKGVLHLYIVYYLDMRNGNITKECQHYEGMSTVRCWIQISNYSKWGQIQDGTNRPSINVIIHNTLYIVQGWISLLKLNTTEQSTNHGIKGDDISNTSKCNMPNMDKVSEVSTPIIS